MEGPWRHNLSRLYARLEEEGLDALILGSPSNIRYTTGIREPTGVAVLGPKCGYTLIVPLLDYHRILSQAPSSIEVKASYRAADEGLEADIPRGDLVRDTPVRAGLEVAKGCGSKIGGDLSAQPYGQARVLAEAGVGDYTSLVSGVRAVKSEGELRLIEEAVRAAEEVLSRAVSLVSEGVSESEVAGEILRGALVKGEGASFPPIVAFYSNTAYPHHTPTGLRLGVEGPVLIDMGVIVDGYRSDITRTMYYGRPPRGFSRVLESVVNALDSALDVIAPGVEAWEPDKEARLILEREGLARHFIHGLGHGVGVDIHEEPYLRPGSKTVLEEGMVVTVEPGVYMAGSFGVRVEEMVLVTGRGRRLLTRFSRILDGLG